MICDKRILLTCKFIWITGRCELMDERVIHDLSEVFELSISEVITHYDVLSNTLVGSRIKVRYAFLDFFKEIKNTFTWMHK